MPLDRKRLVQLGAQALVIELKAQLNEALKLAGESAASPAKRPATTSGRKHSARMKAWWRKHKADIAAGKIQKSARKSAKK